MIQVKLCTCGEAAPSSKPQKISIHLPYKSAATAFRLCRTDLWTIIETALLQKRTAVTVYFLSKQISSLLLHDSAAMQCNLNQFKHTHKALAQCHVIIGQSSACLAQQRSRIWRGGGGIVIISSSI